MRRPALLMPNPESSVAALSIVASLSRFNYQTAFSLWTISGMVLLFWLRAVFQWVIIAMILEFLRAVYRVAVCGTVYHDRRHAAAAICLIPAPDNSDEYKTSGLNFSGILTILCFPLRKATMTAVADGLCARYHELDANSPRLAAKLKEVKRHLDPVANSKKLQKLENDLAQQSPSSTRKQKLLATIERLKRQISSDSSRRQLESLLAELESQQTRETTKMASLRVTLPPSPAQTLIPDLLSEIFLHFNVSGPKEAYETNGLGLHAETQTKLNILRVCATWRAVALDTPLLWRELHYTDYDALPLEFYHIWLCRAASVPLDLDIWPTRGPGDSRYWAGAAELLNTHCRTLVMLRLKLPIWQYSRICVPPLFPPPHRPTNLRNLTIHWYDDQMHNTLANIPWSQLSRLEFRIRNEVKFISPTQLASILSQAVHLTHLVADLGPGKGFGPSSIDVLNMLELQTLEISWIEPANGYFDGNGRIPHCFIDVFDKLFAPALKSLTVKIDPSSDTVFLPALTSLAARCQFPLESLHISMPDISTDTLIDLLSRLPTLTFFHWDVNGTGLPGVLEALTFAGGRHTLLPNLVDISLLVGSYDGLLPAFADMVMSRRASKCDESSTVTSLRHFQLHCSVDSCIEGTTLLSSPSQAAKQDAFSRLKDLTVADNNTRFRGLLRSRHLDQELEPAKLGSELTPGWKGFQVPRLDGDNFLYCDDDLVWHWVDKQTAE
ncbi:hypothetical protein C8R45DRAFT_1010663 [Mycena sanguinolenta]|nr:hypothetical protein C8R45DRAFT_1010663 [Mycena sanguinolenta]